MRGEGGSYRADFVAVQLLRDVDGELAQRRVLPLRLPQSNPVRPSGRAGGLVVVGTEGAVR